MTFFRKRIMRIPIKAEVLEVLWHNHEYYIVMGNGKIVFAIHDGLRYWNIWPGKKFIVFHYIKKDRQGNIIKEWFSER